MDIINHLVNNNFITANCDNCNERRFCYFRQSDNKITTCHFHMSITKYYNNEKVIIVRKLDFNLVIILYRDRYITVDKNVLTNKPMFENSISLDLLGGNGND